MRTRMRVLICAIGTVLALGIVAGPVAAAEEITPKECIEILQKAGDKANIDECEPHEAPSPLAPEPNEIIWGSLAFLVLLVAMWKWGVPAVRNMEKAREDRIRGDLEAAERARSEAEAEKQRWDAQLAGSRDEAGRIIDEARQAAERVRQDLIARAEDEAREIRERAQADIANQRTQAMAQLRDEVAALSIDLAGRIVERNLDDDTNRRLVESFIDQAARSN